MRSDTFDNLPVDESTLAALVEGDLRGPEADAVRERLLRADPALAARIEMMEHDRLMLRAMGDETPPPGLADAIVATLEREALLGIAGDDERGPIPISTVPGAASSSRGFGRWIASPAGAGLALAAMLTIAAGVTLQFMGGSRPATPPIGPGSNSAGLLPDVATNDAPDVRRETGPRVAGDVAQPEPPQASVAAEADRPAPPAELFFTDDFERAAALLAQGRLLVRVRCTDPGVAASAIDRLAARSARPGEMWRIGEDVSSPVILAMESHFAPEPIDTAPFVIASEESVPERVRRTQPRSALEGVFMADTRTQPAALAALRAAMSLGDGQHAVFEELETPLETGRVLTADAVLWWARAPEDWSRRAFVPVVIERVDR